MAKGPKWDIPIGVKKTKKKASPNTEVTEHKLTIQLQFNSVVSKKDIFNSKVIIELK